MKTTTMTTTTTTITTIATHSLTTHYNAPKCTTDPKLPFSLDVHLHNQLCTHEKETALEPNFVPS